jgi:hypothetical protein
LRSVFISIRNAGHVHLASIKAYVFQKSEFLPCVVNLNGEKLSHFIFGINIDKQVYAVH